MLLYFHGPSLLSMSVSDPDATKVGGLPLSDILVGQYPVIPKLQKKGNKKLLENV